MDEIEQESGNIRDLLPELIGQRIIELSQHDKEEFDPITQTGSYIMLMFESGDRFKVWIGDEGMLYLPADSDEDEG